MTQTTHGQAADGPGDNDAGGGRTPGSRRTPAPVRLAGWIATVQGGAALASAAYLVVHAALGYRESDVVISGYGTAAWFTLVGGAVFAAGIGLLRGRRWGRGLVIMAELLLLPVAWYLGSGSGRHLAGIAVAAVALTALVSLFRPAAVRWYQR